MAAPTGFLRQFGQRQAYGDGVYFAVNAAYSANPAYSVPDSQGLQYMFLCKVLVGEYCRGSTGMQIPPPKKSNKNETYDSLVDCEDHPTMFVISRDDHAYAEFVVTFQVKGTTTNHHFVRQAAAAPAPAAPALAARAPAPASTIGSTATAPSTPLPSSAPHSPLFSSSPLRTVSGSPYGSGHGISSPSVSSSSAPPPTYAARTPAPTSTPAPSTPPPSSTAPKTPGCLLM